MKKIKLSILLSALCSMLMFNAFSQPKTFDDAIEYNDYIIELQTGISNAFQAFINSVTNDESVAAMASLAALISVIEEKIDAIQNLGPFEENTAFRDAGIELFKFYKTIAENEYQQILDIKFKPDATEDDYAKLEELVLKIQEKEKVYDEKFLSSQQDFADTYHFTLTAPDLTDIPEPEPKPEYIEQYTQPDIQPNMPEELVKIVNDFLNYMIDGNQEEMKKMISPYYKKINSLKQDKYTVNNYGLTGFVIFSYDPSSNLITTHIWGNNQSWVHELTFTLIKEKGKWYIKPSLYDGEWLDPWTNVTPSIHENYETWNDVESNEYETNELETEKSPIIEPEVQEGMPEDRLIVLSDFLNYMKNTNQDGMKGLISPAFKAQNINVTEYRVNYYGLVDFLIYKFDKNTNVFTAHIWGNDKAWEHEVTFTMTNENGKWYILPSSFDGEWIHPWTNVTAYISE